MSSIYRPLDREYREVRLLRVCEDPPNGENGLHFSMTYAALVSSIVEPYTAVSYCWGESNERVSITVDKHEIMVPQSSAEALQRLIQVPGELIWIDAICIDQQDQAEKGHQVSMMADVYSKARDVRVWLGHFPDDTAVSAIDSVRKIHAQCCQATDNLANLQAHLYSGQPLRFQYSDNNLSEAADWKALEALYSLPWFTRLWVVQEVALAQNAVCHVGQHSVAAEILTLAARWMVHRRYAKHFGSREIEGVENASSMYKPTMRPLSNQLRRMHRHKCRDPRDRIYGLLGILSPEVAASIVPNYSLAVVEVYARAMKTALSEDGDLRMLQFVAWYVEKPDPPKGSLSRGLWSVQTAFRKMGGASATGTAWPSWVLKMNATSDSDYGSCYDIPVMEGPAWQLDMRAMDDPYILSVKGVVADRITSVSEPFSKENLQCNEKLAALFLECLRQSRRTIGRGQHATSPRDHALTFVCGTDALNGDRESDANLGSDYDCFMVWCQSSVRSWRTSVGVQDQPLPQYGQTIWRSLNRRFFTTADGRIGMGPLGMQAGDNIALLSGCRVPFILREMGRNWSLVGDAYCRCFMKEISVDAPYTKNQCEKRGEWLDIR